jgi:hypothetical protein
MSGMKRLLAAVLLLAGTARAEQACFVSYEGFEETVRHMDLDACPGGEPTPEQGFCRVALIGADFFVYEFRHGEAGPCLVRVHPWRFNDFVARYGTEYRKP